MNKRARLLKQIKAESEEYVKPYLEKGVRVGDAPVVNAFEPNEQYPSPWRAVGRPSEPWTVYSANNKQVATWLTETEAKQIQD